MEPPDEVRELLVGTWTGVALIVEGLVQSGMIAREDVVVPLSQGEALAKDRRRIALTALRSLIENGFGEAVGNDQPDKICPDATRRA